MYLLPPLKSKWKIFKELQYLYNYCDYCYWDGKIEKAKYIMDNMINSYAENHPIIDYLAYLFSTMPLPKI